MMSLNGTNQSALSTRRNGSIRKNCFAAPQRATYDASERGSNVRANCVALLQCSGFERVRSAQVHERHVGVVAGREPSLMRDTKSFRGRRGGQLRNAFERQPAA